MFSISATFEDLTLTLLSQDGFEYTGTIADRLTEESRTVKLSAQEVSDILAFNLDPDGAPEGWGVMYARLEPTLARLGIASGPLRPIP